MDNLPLSAEAGLDGNKNMRNSSQTHAAAIPGGLSSN